MEELKGVNEVKVDNNELVEVKSYKKADNKLLKKVALAIGTILVAVLVYCNFFNNGGAAKEEAPQDDNIVPAASVTLPSSTVPTPNIVPNNGGQGGPTDNSGDSKKSCDPDTIESNWETEKLPAESTTNFNDVEESLKKEDTLTPAQKAYVEEYMDYYGISYNDAITSYFEFGPLVVPTDNYAPTDANTVEYETKYVFDADDLAAINLYVSELGMTRSEAENYYVTVIAPNLGKTISTDIIMLRK